MREIWNSSVLVTLGLALNSGCQQQKPPENPNLAVVHVPFEQESKKSPLNPESARKSVIRKPIIEASEEVRGRIFDACYIEEPHQRCAIDELHAFFDLANQLRFDARKACYIGEGYDHQCMEKAFEQAFSGTVEHDRYKAIQAVCNAYLHKCIDRKLSELKP